LESVANAHTAADLHVRPVSKTALVSRSWAPRTIKEIHDGAYLAIGLVTALADSSATVAALPRCVGKQVFESPRGIARVI